MYLLMQQAQLNLITVSWCRFHDVSNFSNRYPFTQLTFFIYHNFLVKLIEADL